MNITITDLREFMFAVADMRKAQQTDKNHRSHVTGQRARNAEAKVDELLAKHQLTPSPDKKEPDQGNLWS